MKKLVLGVLLAVISVAANAENGEWQPLQVKTVAPDFHQAPQQYKQAAEYKESLYSAFAEYYGNKGKFANDIDADLEGFALGFSTSPNKDGFWGKFEYLTNDDYDADYFEVAFGGHKNFYSANNVYILGNAGLGIGVANAGTFDDTLYLTLPIELELGYRFAQNLSIYGGVGYKWAWDITNGTGDKTLCNDGTWSDSTGSGTCSWHQGVNPYQPADNTIGDFDGVTYKAGLRYSF